jgi:hypothetical protein
MERKEFAAWRVSSSQALWKERVTPTIWYANRESTCWSRVRRKERGGPPL